MGDLMKIAYMGIDLMYPVLESLIRDGVEIMELFTCPTDNVTEFNTSVIKTADNMGIPWTQERIKERDLNRLEADGCQAIICAGYYYRAPVSDKIPMVNFHPAPLPEYRGAWPMPQILLRGENIGGVTVHKMARELDTGDILMREEFTLSPWDTLQDYMNKVYEKIPDMVNEVVYRLPQLLKSATPQMGGHYWPNPTEKDWTIRSDMCAEEADRILRAFYGYECMYSDGQRQWEIIEGIAHCGKAEEKAFPVRNGYITAERVRAL